MTDNLEETLVRHGEWLNSGGTAGKRADLSGQDLRLSELAGARLDHALLRATNLERADLAGASLQGADLRRALLGYANLDGAQLQQADLSHAAAPGARLRGANLGGALLNEARLDDALCEGADLAGVQARLASLKRADLSRAVLDEAHFEDVALTDANLTGARLHGGRLTGVDLLGAELHGFAVQRTVGEEVAVDPGVVVLERPDEEIELSAQARRRALRLQRQGKPIGEIARVLRVPRAVARANLGSAELESERRGRISRRVRHARIVGLVGIGALALAMLAGVLVIGTGLADFTLTLWRGQSMPWPTGWYLLWSALGIACAVGGVFALWRRDRLYDAINAMSRTDGADEPSAPPKPPANASTSP
jgi:uncharacterized protein YjbI with pentapeptide repeats